MKTTLRIISQAIIGILVLILGIPMAIFTLPEHGNYCDADQIYMYYYTIFFILLSVSFLINSVMLYLKKHWVKYRRIAIRGTLLLWGLILCGNSIFTLLIYGQQRYEITNKDDSSVLVNMRLYDNHKFIARTYDVACVVENTGTYELNNDELTLTFNGEKSTYLETKYIIIDNQLNCLFCDHEIPLVMEEM